MPLMNKAGLITAGALGILLLAGIAAFLYASLYQTLTDVRGELARTQATAADTEAALEERLRLKTEEAIGLEGELRLLEEEHDDSTRTVRKLSDTVNDLEKVIATDPELLAKYSKVYFLNENYAPATLATIATSSTFQPDRTYEVHAEVAPYLEDLLKEANEEGLSLLIASAYRSFSEQAALKSGYRIRYGTGANAFSAEQGYSEHQLGTTIDFTTPEVGGTFAGFDRTEEYAWLMKHAWKYGFVLSYPKGNSYYQYEPWHWRFVGKDLAERLHEDDAWFYDLDQRVIDTYLGELFD